MPLDPAAYRFDKETVKDAFDKCFDELRLHLSNNEVNRLNLQADKIYTCLEEKPSVKVFQNFYTLNDEMFSKMHRLVLKKQLSGQLLSNVCFEIACICLRDFIGIGQEIEDEDHGGIVNNCEVNIFVVYRSALIYFIGANDLGNPTAKELLSSLYHGSIILKDLLQPNLLDESRVVTDAMFLRAHLNMYGIGGEVNPDEATNLYIEAITTFAKYNSNKQNFDRWYMDLIHSPLLSPDSVTTLTLAVSARVHAHMFEHGIGGYDINHTEAMRNYRFAVAKGTSFEKCYRNEWMPEDTVCQTHLAYLYKDIEIWDIAISASDDLFHSITKKIKSKFVKNNPYVLHVINEFSNKKEVLAKIKECSQDEVGFSAFVKKHLLEHIRDETLHVHKAKWADKLLKLDFKDRAVVNLLEQTAAEFNDAPAAMYELAKIYFEDTSHHTTDEVVKLLECAAKLKYPPAMYTLGRLFWSQNNYGKAIEFFEKVTEPQHAPEMYELAKNRWKEKPHDTTDEVVKLLECVVKFNHVPAMYALGKIYCHKNDYKQAIELFKNAAELNHVPAMYELAKIYWEDKSAEAVKLFESAAKQKYPPAMYELAKIYLEDKSNDKTNEAVKLLKKAADLRHASACHTLATVYENGQTGVDKDCTQAAQFYQRAVMLGTSFKDCYRDWMPEDAVCKASLKSFQKAIQNMSINNITTSDDLFKSIQKQIPDNQAKYNPYVLHVIHEFSNKKEVLAKIKECSQDEVGFSAFVKRHLSEYIGGLINRLADWSPAVGWGDYIRKRNQAVIKNCIENKVSAEIFTHDTSRM